MGSYPGAEICELIGLFLLQQLVHGGIQAILYRDDGAVLTSSPSKQVQIQANKIVKIFKEQGLNITIAANLKVINFLDVTLDCENNLYKPFVKENHISL